ncbi:AMP-binding protein [Streptomyces albidoflavus]
MTVPRLLTEAAERFGEHVAVVDGGAGVDYRRLAHLAGTAARAFIAAGVRPGDRVAVWLPNRLEFIVALLGAQSAGAVAVPLNTRYRGQEAADVLARSRAVAVVLAGGFLGTDYLGMLRSAASDGAPGPADAGPVPGLPHLRTVVDAGPGTPAPGVLSWTAFIRLAERVATEEAARVALAVRPDDVCDLLFTSGTTGVPKGVISSHRQTVGVGRVWAEGAELTPRDRYAIVNPFFHSFGYKAGFVAAFTAGASVHPVQVFDATAVLELIQAEGISVLPGAPTLFLSLLGHPRLREFDTSSLRFATCGASTVPTRLFQRMREELGFSTVAQAYGLTECVVATRSRPGESPEHVAETTGPAVPGLEIRVIGPDGRDMPLGHDGEILIRGELVTRGYFEDDEATRAAFDERGWFRTGDVGRLDEHGCLRITDRLKDVITVGGFNVYPAEVENALCTHPDVEEAAVVGAADERMGSVPVAHVVPRRGRNPDPEALIAFCAGRLANFKVPRRVVLVPALPRNPSGKILKTALRGASRG